MKVSIDVHFGYGVVFSAGTSGGLLAGLYANEAISIPFFIGSTAAYAGFHFAAMWFHRSNQNYHAEKTVREHQQDEYLASLLEHQMNPLKLEPTDMQLSSLMRRN